MKLALLTDAWAPQVNGVVVTLVELVRELRLAGHEVLVVHPGEFRTRPCPGYAGIDLALNPGPGVAARLDAFGPDAIHLATEGPLGWAGRRHCRQRGLAFTTAFHTRFPEILQSAARVPLALGYAVVRHFHRPSSGVLVPTDSVLGMLAGRGVDRLRPWTHGVDTDLFAFQPRPLPLPELAKRPRPYSLFVGRVSYEKNIDAFLRMPFPGTKIVCGVGPVEQRLKREHPQAHWVGLLPRDELAKVYGAADLFVFPSRSDTFGLVMLEAMACGTPVAAFPVEGPLEVLARPGRDGAGSLGGAMDADLQQACFRALRQPRHEARERALDFTWRVAADLFLGHLVRADRGGPAVPGRPVTKLSSTPVTLS